MQVKLSDMVCKFTVDCIEVFRQNSHATNALKSYSIEVTHHTKKYLHTFESVKHMPDAYRSWYANVDVGFGHAC
jgi:hypothetical protein